MNKALALILLVACGPKPAPAPIPTLPTDGDAHVAKPPAEPAVSQAPDAWASKQLIAAPQTKAAGKLDLPAIDSFKLANGLDVYVIKNDRLPVVNVQVAIKAGRMDEPRARLGVAEATADMLVKGTQKHSAEAFAKAIDFVGGTIAVDSTFEATLVSCSVLARNLSTCMQLVPEAITQPTFPDDELAKVKENMLGEVRQRQDDAAALASAHVQNLLWGNDHVRGWINSEASVAALRRDDLVAFHKAWYSPTNAQLVVTGDVDSKKLKAQLEAAFAGWKKTQVPPVPSYPEPGLSGIRIRLVDKPGQTQTHIRIAQFGIKHQDPRFFDTLVWNYALGGGAFSSRLMKVVRVEGGKTYGASSSFDRNLDKGSFVAQSFTRNAEAVATTKLMLGEITKMAKSGPTQAEVDAAIANIAGGYAMRFQAASDLGAALTAAELHGFGTEYLQNYPLAVGKVTVDEAKRAAGEILDPKNYVIVMVGDAKDVEPQLKKEGWRYEKMAASEPITPEVKQPEAPADPKAVAAAKALLDAAVGAKGGKAKLAAMKAFRIHATGTTTVSAGGQSQTLPVEIERVFVLPDKMRIDADIAKQMKVVVGVDGAKAWTIQPTADGKNQLSEIKDMASVDFERWRDPELILLKATDPAAKLTPAPDETVDGKPMAVIKLASPQQGLGVSLYIDKKTKLIARMVYEMGPGQTETDEFSDYRDVKGVKFAYKRSSQSPGRVTKLDVDKVEVDPKVEPSLFGKPANP